MAKYEARRLRLLALRDRDFHSSNSALARKIGKDPSYLSRLFYPPGREGRRRMGESLLDAIEQAFPWPRGWMNAQGPLPPRTIQETRRANLRHWASSHPIAVSHRHYVSQLLRGAELDSAGARRLEFDHKMDAGYLDQPVVEPARDVLATPQTGADGIYAGTHEAGHWRHWLDLSTELRRVLTVYLDGSPQRQEAIRELAQLPAAEMPHLLELMKAMQARGAA